MPHPVYLVRHGQSEWNVRRLTQGQSMHPALTDVGRTQAEAAAELVAADLPAGVAATVVSSDLTRATQTAHRIGARLGVPVTTDVRLREQHLGTLEGRPYEETWAAAEAHDWSDPTLPVAGGESLMDVSDRMVAAYKDLDRSVVTVLVSHGDAIRVLLAHLEGVGPHEAGWVEVANGSVARVTDRVTWLGSR